MRNLKNRLCYLLYLLLGLGLSVSSSNGKQPEYITVKAIVKNIDTSLFKEGQILAVGDSGKLIIAKVDTVKVEDAINKMCLERGHVMSNPVSVTLAYCPPYLLETDSISYRVFPSCNETTSVCERCGLIVKYYPKEQRIVIWRKEDTNLNVY